MPETLNPQSAQPNEYADGFDPNTQVELSAVPEMPGMQEIAVSQGTMQIGDTALTDVLVLSKVQSTGNVTVETNVTQVTRSFESNGVVYETDIPADVELFSPGYGEPNIIPSAIDKLSAGAHSLTHIEEIPGEFGGTEKYTVSRPINITETTVGLALNVDAFAKAPHDRWPFNKTVTKLATELGFVYTGFSVESIPTPATLVETAQAHGVEIELIPDTGQISSQEYLDVFNRGKYPVSTADETYYKHDIQDDHLFAVVLGGESLKGALSTVAEKALSSNDQEQMNNTTGNIDSFTAILRLVLYSGQGEAFGREKGRTTILNQGAELGLDYNTTLAILAEAKENAIKYGIESTEHLS